MEIINVEKQTFESMLAKFEAFAQRVETMCTHSGDKSMQKWLDNQEVCQLLNISKRTLQTYRDNGTLPYSQIGHKIFYRPDDVQQMFEKSAIIHKE